MILMHISYYNITLTLLVQKVTGVILQFMNILCMWCTVWVTWVQIDFECCNWSEMKSKSCIWNLWRKVVGNNDKRAARISSSAGLFDNLNDVVNVVMSKLSVTLKWNIYIFDYIWLYLSKSLQRASHVWADDVRCKLVHYFSACTSCCLHMALYISPHMLYRRQLSQLVALIPSLLKRKSTYLFLLL